MFFFFGIMRKYVRCQWGKRGKNKNKGMEGEVVALGSMEGSNARVKHALEEPFNQGPVLSLLCRLRDHQ